MIAAMIATLVIVPLLPMTIMLMGNVPTTAVDAVVPIVKYIKEKDQPICHLTEDNFYCEGDK